MDKIPVGGPGQVDMTAAEAHRARWMARLGCAVAEQDGWLLVAHPDLQWPLFNYACPAGAPGGGMAPGGGGAAAPGAGAAAWLAARGRLPCFLMPAGAPAPLPGIHRGETQAVLAAAAPHRRHRRRKGCGSGRSLRP